MKTCQQTTFCIYTCAYTMQKHKENLFCEKFSLLKSQEHNEDIKWSSSSSSDYENTSSNDKTCCANKTHNRKRKRKKKIPKNISNLDITIVDTSKEHKNHLRREKSPILPTKTPISPMSPILRSSKIPPNQPNSPILSARNLHKRSPILIAKSASPKYSAKVRKKMSFIDEQACEKMGIESYVCDFVKSDKSFNHGSTVDEILNRTSVNENKGKESIDSSISMNTTDEKSEISDKSDSALKAKLNIINKVKNYFDNNFSSESTSLNISDTPTPEESIKTETIEILTCRTQSLSSIPPLKHESSNSDTTNYFEKNKKVKYKKGGLAYRLNTLLKKQTAHISLWQHERFLVGNSNFVIPKGEHIVFCIQKVVFLYGCYLLDAVDVKNEKYIIFINRLYVDNNICNESVFKLYEPYRILELDDSKVVINVCKFECINLKS